ncbi:sigma-54-dependent Fis family transcriptional regulator [Brucella gallinifaecis]|uniref:Sigma-54-dependent Fis family transcriptional regulator n=2 Tax=Brucella gallinifaecis TaxID=215590 RepID=A0A502BU70_9HYPH|nr:sigma-54-dependent Fis family transcriptional regulator [Brucella gallinifaecis]
MNIPVILVDDDEALRRATRQTLELAGYAVTDFGSASEALSLITSSFDGVVITDVRMPQIDGLQLFARIRQIDADLPVILITGHGDIAMAVQAIQDGAYDFISKPFATEQLIHSVRRAGERRKLILENRRLRELASDAQNAMPLIGQTAAIENLRRTICDIADTDVDVLIAGETGSGKEVVAQLLHDWGRRRKGNFVALNCGALPETVIESELFGHEAGAFTGAQKKRIGRIEHASGGTLFLDEIESMPVATQVKLLRVLEMREITPLGTNEVRPIDLRVVAAAKTDLGNPEQRGDFREDLYYRLNVVTLAIPPLRERREDIPLLFSHFLTQAARRFNREIPVLDTATHRYLMEHNWPGNVRELMHFAERFSLSVTIPDRAPVSQDHQGTLPQRLEKFEASLIREALAAHNGNVQNTLEALGIPRKTFYDKMQRHGINRADYKTAYTGEAIK